MTKANRFLDKVEAIAAPYGLMAMGGAHADRDQTVVLIGTAATFWDQFVDTPEYNDGQPDPVDRWSLRVIPLIMNAAGANDAVYPFGGPPYAPFLSWAKLTGEAFDSPVGMLVHHRAGLMISYRGGLLFDGHLPLPDIRPKSPCETCAAQPCTTACPVDALSDQHAYNVPDCKAFLGTSEGETCMENGCAVRRICPVSESFARPREQSAHHMRAFRGELQ